jgi:flavin-dependent dehydrogenase
MLASLKERGIATESHSVRFISPGLKMMELSFRQKNTEIPPGLICKRIDFDSFLLEKSLEYPGIRFLPGTQVSGFRRSGNSILLIGRLGDLIAETSLILFAAGFNEPLIRQLDPSWNYTREDGLGVRGYFENVTGSAENHAIEIHFLEELLPWYLWIFPFAGGSANVGLALPESLARKKKESLKELLFLLIDHYPHLNKRFKNASLSGKIEANRLPYYSAPVRAAGDHYLLLGDSARLIDPFTGEGIGNAMISGRLAAAVAAQCLEEKNFSFSATREYQKQLHMKLGAELKMSRRMQKLAHHRSLLNLVIGKASGNEKVRTLIEEMLYDETAKKKFKNPLFYIKLLPGL